MLKSLVSDAALDDSQAVDLLLMRGDTASSASADAAHRFEEMEAKLRDRKLTSHIHQNGKPLTERAEGHNWTKFTVRVQVEHIFDAQVSDIGGNLVRTIGLVRAEAKIGMKNFAHNMRRLVQLCRINPKSSL